MTNADDAHDDADAAVDNAHAASGASGSRSRGSDSGGGGANGRGAPASPATAGAAGSGVSSPYHSDDEWGNAAFVDHSEGRDAELAVEYVLSPPFANSDVLSTFLFAAPTLFSCVNATHLLQTRATRAFRLVYHAHLPLTAPL
jgi:hypothetical protein